jgi:hypothetical protein
MLPFGVTIPATVPQWSEIPEGLMNNPVFIFIFMYMYIYIIIFVFNQHNKHCGEITPGSANIVIQKPATEYGYDLPHQTPTLTSIFVECYPSFAVFQVFLETFFLQKFCTPFPLRPS